MDRNWWHEYGNAVKEGPELWTTNREAARLWRLRWIQGEPGGGESTRANTIKMGGNSGFQALALALHFGASRVVLLGYDMQLGASGATHWHGDHKRLGNPLKDRMPKWCRDFAEIPFSTRQRVVNASRVSALKCFKRAGLNDCLAEPET